MASQRAKLKPRPRQNSFRRMPLLGTSTQTAGLRLGFGAHAGLPSVLPSSCQFSTGPAPSQGVLVRRLQLSRSSRRSGCDAAPDLYASSKSLTDMPRLVLHMEYAADLVMADQLELALAWSRRNCQFIVSSKRAVRFLTEYLFLHSRHHERVQ
jgi:hypothetical protein